MTIQLKNGKPASEETIVAIEKVLGCLLSESVRRFLAVHDGAKPESNSCKVTEKCSFAVRRFIPAADVLLYRKYIDDLPEKAYPVAEDDCGNFVIVDEGKNGAVYFWDHEVRGDPIELASSFGGFLDLLSPFDASTIQLEPTLVKRVWLDPEFLKRLKK
jgi:hypothetical protein